MIAVITIAIRLSRAAAGTGGIPNVDVVDAKIGTVVDGVILSVGREAHQIRRTCATRPTCRLPLNRGDLIIAVSGDDDGFDTSRVDCAIRGVPTIRIGDVIQDHTMSRRGIVVIFKDEDSLSTIVITITIGLGPDHRNRGEVHLSGKGALDDQRTCADFDILVGPIHIAVFDITCWGLVGGRLRRTVTWHRLAIQCRIARFIRVP